MTHHAVKSRQGNKPVPLGIDMMPKNTREQVIYKLDKTYDWEKVADLNMAEVHEDSFIPLLHNVDGDKMQMFEKKMD